MIVTRDFIEGLFNDGKIAQEEWLQLQTLMWRCSHGTHIRWDDDMEAVVPYTGLSLQRLRDLGIAPEAREDDWWFT